MADGQVVYEIVGDASNVNKTVKQVTSTIQSESKKWDQAVDDSMDKAGESFLNWKTVAAGAITVTRKGASSSIPTDDEVRALIMKEDLI